MRHPVLLLLLATWFVGCTTSKPIVISKPAPSTPTETLPTTVTTYDEDLSLVRPKYQEPALGAPEKKPEPKKPVALPATSMAITKQVDAALDTMAVRNRAMRFAAGFRIQVYVGNVRADADAARLFTYQNFAELNPYMNYTAPTYRIRVGDFMSRLDAERYLGLLKNQFPAATIQPEKIEIRKTISVK